MRLPTWLRWRTDRELAEEIETHLELEIQNHLERGASPEEARYAALRKLGNGTLIRERAREADPLGWIESAAGDIRLAVRGLARNPGFTAAAILTLGLGIGANTAIFSVANSVLFAPLPYPDSGRVMWLTNEDTRFGQEVVAGPDYADWRKQAQAFDAIMGYEAQSQALAAGSHAAQILTVWTLGDFWKITGAQLVLGRPFTPGERGVMVLGYDLFRRQFQGDPNILGQTVKLDGEPTRVIGVMRPGFRFVLPTQGVYGPTLDSQIVEAYLPGSEEEINAQTRSGPMEILSVVGRRKPGVSAAAARADVQSIQDRISVQAAAFYSRLRLRVLPLHERLVAGSRPALLILLASVGLVLLIACANVANLLLARTAAREREISIRTALGAGRPRLIRQLLTESLTLAGTGGALGLVLAYFGIAAAVRFGPADVPRLQDAGINGIVLAFTVAVSAVTGLLFGIGPALALSKTAPSGALRQSGGVSSHRMSNRIRGCLAAAEIALALVLLTGAGLLIKSFFRMNAHPPGFDPAKILVMQLQLSGPQYRDREAVQDYAREALARVEHVPGVMAAGLSGIRVQAVVSITGRPPFPPGQGPLANFRAVSAGYPRALGMQLVAGRLMADQEPERVAMMNQTAARRVFGRENPVGKQIQVPGSGPRDRDSVPATVVGVVADLKYSKLDADPDAEIYLPIEQANFVRVSQMLIRTAANPKAVAGSLTGLISSINPGQPVFGVKTLDQELADSIAPRRFNMLLLEIFAGIAVLLAVIGIYGVMAYAVQQRTQEIGVRMALGAQPAGVVGMVIREGMLFAAAGLAAGIAAAFWLTRLMAGLLYEVKPSDGPTFTLVSAMLALAAFLACWVPARRAARIDPAAALRHS